ncbi:hypothetical protein Tco_0995107 [Tanacetum coccineum]
MEYFNLWNLWVMGLPRFRCATLIKILDDEPGHNHGVVDLTGDEDLTDEDGDTRMGDSTGVSVSLGGEISLGGKKSQESNICRGTIAGEIDSKDKRSLVKSSEESGEIFPGEAIGDIEKLGDDKERLWK